VPTANSSAAASASGTAIRRGLTPQHQAHRATRWATRGSDPTRAPKPPCRCSCARL
jgi:hypothetical protein